MLLGQQNRFPTGNHTEWFSLRLLNEQESFTPTLKAYWGKSDLQEVLNLVTIGKRRRQTKLGTQRGRRLGSSRSLDRLSCPLPVPGPTSSSPDRLHKRTLDGLPRSPGWGQRCRVKGWPLYCESLISSVRDSLRLVLQVPCSWHRTQSKEGGIILKLFLGLLHILEKCCLFLKTDIENCYKFGI